MARIYLACDRAAFFASLPAGTGPDAPRGVDSRGDFRVDSRGGEGGVDFPLSETSSLAIRFGATMVHYFRERVDQETEEVNVIAMLNSLDLLIHLLGRPFLLLAMPTLSSLVLVILDYNVATVPRFHVDSVHGALHRRRNAATAPRSRALRRLRPRAPRNPPSLPRPPFRRFHGFHFWGVLS